MMEVSRHKGILIIEPFYGGSHKQLVDTIVEGFNSKDDKGICLITLTAKKWHWRARTSALHLSEVIPREHNFRILFASSVLNLVDLVALRPDLASLKKVIYFHENQLAYPIQKEKERDFQYGYNQILTCLVADVVIFNSDYNLHSFLTSINKFFKLQPDNRPKGLSEKIGPKCRVLHFPIKFPTISSPSESNNDVNIVHIVWPHRWEHDKDPDLFFRVLISLYDSGCKFRLSVLGEMFTTKPPIFKEAAAHLKDAIEHWGFLPSKQAYYAALQSANVVVSTAKHEFYGVSMLEAVYCGCFPVCPDALVYPEIYPRECLYKDEKHLFKILRNLCYKPKMAGEMRRKLNIDLSKYSVEHLIDKYREIISS